MKLPIELLRSWENRFPDLFDKWTHWKIVGDEYCIAVVEGTNLGEAIKIIKDNYDKYSSIKTWRVTVDKDGNIQDEDDKRTHEISNFINDEPIRKRYEKKDA